MYRFTRKASCLAAAALVVITAAPAGASTTDQGIPEGWHLIKNDDGYCLDGTELSYVKARTCNPKDQYQWWSSSTTEPDKLINVYRNGHPDDYLTACTGHTDSKYVRFILCGIPMASRWTWNQATGEIGYVDSHGRRRLTTGTAADGYEGPNNVIVVPVDSSSNPPKGRSKWSILKAPVE